MLNGKLETYEIVKIFEFTNERKLMTVVVRSNTSSRLLSFTKGADEIIRQRLSEITDACKRNLSLVNEFASEGLRTMGFAMRELMIERELLEKGIVGADDIERGLSLLGVSGIED